MRIPNRLRLEHKKQTIELTYEKDTTLYLAIKRQVEPPTDTHKSTFLSHIQQELAVIALLCISSGVTQYVAAEATVTITAKCTYATAPATSNEMIVIGVLIDRNESSKVAILIADGQIGQIGDVEEIQAKAPRARLLNCDGVYISPGFVNAHEHPPYSAGKPGPNVAPVYNNRYQWQGRGGEQYPEIAYARVETDAELYWIELRHLLSGTTTMAGNGAVPGLLKNVGSGDQESGFVYQADMKTFPFPQAIDEFEQLPWPYEGPSVKPELTDGADVHSPFVPHIAEGTDKISRLEAKFFLDYVAANPGRRYAMIHGVGLHRDSASRLQSLDVTLVWAPRSNLALYGETVDLPHLMSNGARIALSTDWSYSGSYNMLESFRCAEHIDRERWGNQLSRRDLWLMATTNGAYALNLERTTGSVKPGLAADLVLIRSKSNDPFADLTESDVEDIVATFVDGELVAGSRSAFNTTQLPNTCSNVVGSHFVCDDLSHRDFTWNQLLQVNESSIPLFESRGQANCTF